MPALEEIDLTGFSLVDEHGALRMIRSLDPEFFDMARTDEDSDWVNDSSPRLNLVACPSVSLAKGLIEKSNSGPCECGDPTISITQQPPCASVRAVSNTSSGANVDQAKGDVNRLGSECIEIVVDSGADASCLPANFQFYGESMGQDGPGFLDAQGNELDIHDRRTCFPLPQVRSGGSRKRV